MHKRQRLRLENPKCWCSSPCALSSATLPIKNVKATGTGCNVYNQQCARNSRKRQNIHRVPQ